MAKKRGRPKGARPLRSSPLCSSPLLSSALLSSPLLCSALLSSALLSSALLCSPHLSSPLLFSSLPVTPATLPHAPQVDSGGETAFPAVGGGIKVTPTKGSAILWPSTYNDQPMTAGARTHYTRTAVALPPARLIQRRRNSRPLPLPLISSRRAADQRTVHEAMPVHEGIKFGANMWIHQFSFKTPSERGCELTYVNTVGNQPQSEEQRRLARRA